VAGIDPARLTVESRLQEEAGLDSLQLAELAERVGRGSSAGSGAGGSGGNGSGIGSAGAPPAEGIAGLRTLGDLARRLAARPGASAGAGAAAGGDRAGAKALLGLRSADATERSPFALPASLKAAGNALLTFLQKKAYEGPLRVEVSGREQIPWSTPSIVVANHASHLDVGLLKHALGEYARHATSLGARDYFFQSPLRRLYFESFTEVMPVDRDDPSRERLADVVERLQSGHTVILFPEGTRSTSGRIGRFRAGLGYLVSKARVGVIPVYLDGTHEALPKGALVPRRRDLGARIGRYLPPEELLRLGEGLSRHQAYRAIAEAVRLELAALGRAHGADVELEAEGEQASGFGLQASGMEQAPGLGLQASGLVELAGAEQASGFGPQASGLVAPACAPDGAGASVEPAAAAAALGAAGGNGASGGNAGNGASGATGADLGYGHASHHGNGTGRLQRLLASLPARFKRGAIDRALRIYVKVGEGDDERWTLRLEPGSLTVIAGKGDAPADCVVKSEPRVLERLLAQGELPGFDDILAGRFKTNDPDALRALVDALGLGAAQGT
jgi:1-acyl-sn-glycerol-3-phosphate acyltransferase